MYIWHIWFRSAEMAIRKTFQIFILCLWERKATGLVNNGKDDDRQALVLLTHVTLLFSCFGLLNCFALSCRRVSVSLTSTLDSRMVCDAL